MVSRTWVGICAALTLMVAGGVFAADDTIVFSSAPTQSPAVTVKLYTPLVNYLAKATGKKFVIKPASTFIEYDNAMRAGDYDMLFDGPQFTGWRMEHMGFVPVARLDGNITVVVALADNSKIRTIGDFIGHKVCAFASPNMLTLDFMSYFPNPAQQPMFVREQSFKDILACVKDGNGDAAVLRDTVWAKQDHTGLHLLNQPFHSYPERTFSVAKRIDGALRQKIEAALLTPEALKAAAPILKQFHRQKIVAVDAKVYSGLGRLLAPVWGFQ